MSNKIINSKSVRKNDRLKFKYVLIAMVKRNVRTKYRNSTLGIIWTVLRPLLEMAVYWLIFSQFFANGDPIYHLYLLCGMIAFDIMAEATNVSLPSIVANQGLMRQTKLTYEVFPLSNTISSVVNFLFSFAAMLIIAVITQIALSFNGVNIMMFSPTMLLIVLWLPLLMVFSYGISLLLSSMFVFFRDIQHFYGIFITLWRFATPLFYKLDMMTNEIMIAVININPMTQFVTFFREIMIQGQVPHWTTFLYIAGWAVGTLLIGQLVFKKTKRSFVLYA